MAIAQKTAEILRLNPWIPFAMNADMSLDRRFVIIGILISAGFLRAGTPERASDYLSLPPVFRDFAGDPNLVFKPQREGRDQGRLFGSSSFVPRSGFQSRDGSARLQLRVADGSDRDHVAKAAARTLARAFYREVLRRESLSWHERRLRLDQLFLSGEAQFVKLAEEKLLGRRASEAWFDAWWQVRMGLPQSTDSSRQLVLFLLHYDHFGEKTSTGHLCFGIRHKGGDAENDLLFDFRAPWYVDRQPRLTEAINLHNRLPLSALSLNLYDWLYTQTEYRHCYVDCWFLPISREQVCLLEHLADRPVVHEAGQFRAFRKNCASLGSAFLHRLEPIGRPLPLGRGVADIPTVTARKYLEEFKEEPPFFQLGNVTHERGREATAKSKIHRAQPSRAQSRAFQLLRTASGAN